MKQASITPKEAEQLYDQSQEALLSSYEKAEGLLYAAALAGHPEELFVLGSQACKSGDYPTMLKYWRKAAARGYAKAITNLGWAYFHGNGVRKNYRKCVEFFTRGAALGEPLAIYNLGYRYLEGEGVPRNPLKGLALIRKAHRLGDLGATIELGLIYLEGRHGIPAKPELGVRYLRKAYKQGDDAAANNLGLAYYNGKGVKRNYNKAYKYYAEAAWGGDEVATCNLGVCTLHGHGIPADYDAALELFRDSAARHYESAYYWLGVCHEMGYGTDIDLTQAQHFYTLAAKGGDTRGRSSLHRLHAPLPAAAPGIDAALYHSATAEQNTAAMLAIGLLYEQGTTVRKSLRTARKWYTAAALAGYAQAIPALQRITRAPDKENI